MLFQPSYYRCTVKEPGRNPVRITASTECIVAHTHQECPEDFLCLKDKDTYELFHALDPGILFCRLNTSPSF